MAFWKKKDIKGGRYYYIYESYYQDGKSKQRMLEYIGTIDDVLALAMDAYVNRGPNQADQSSPLGETQKAPSFDTDEIRVRTYTHGDCMAMYYGAKMLGIQNIMDQCFPQKTVKGLPRSEVLVLAMIHRAIDPDSKRQFAGWASTTTLPYYIGFKAADLDSQALWEAMDGITEEMIQDAWNRIVQKMESIFGDTPDIFHMDYSNYFTYVDTQNNRCVICRRGHNKQKRDDLRQFSLAVLTSAELQIPIVWELYEGNKNDKSEFASFIKRIRDTLTEMGREVSDITIVFDGGSNSEENFSGIQFHIACPDSLTSHKELYDISVDEYEEIELSTGKKRQVKRIDDLSFCGIHGVGILTFSEQLKAGKVEELNKDLEKLKETVEDINNRLKNPHSRFFTKMRDREKEVAREIKDIVEYNDKLKKDIEQTEAEEKKARGRRRKPKDIPVWNFDSELLQLIEKNAFEKAYIREFVTISLEKTDNKYQAVIYVDQDRKDAYIKKYYGKRLICTDHVEWSTSAIVEHYADQECIENNIFRVSKDTDHFAIRPQFHWTDQKIKVHVFCCLAAITIAEALRMKCEEQGFHLTKAGMLDSLHLVRDAWVSRGGKEVIRKLEEIDNEETARLWKCISSIGNSASESPAS